jgi:hypothetical protein
MEYRLFKVSKYRKGEIAKYGGLDLQCGGFIYKAIFIADGRMGGSLTGGGIANKWSVDST